MAIPVRTGENLGLRDVGCEGIDLRHHLPAEHLPARTLWRSRESLITFIVSCQCRNLLLHQRSCGACVQTFSNSQLSLEAELY